MVEKFKKKLKENGHSLKWFYDNNIIMIGKKPIYITYSGFTAQLNGYAPISSEIRFKISEYMRA